MIVVILLLSMVCGVVGSLVGTTAFHERNWGGVALGFGVFLVGFTSGIWIPPLFKLLGV